MARTYNFEHFMTNIRSKHVSYSSNHMTSNDLWPPRKTAQIIHSVWDNHTPIMWCITCFLLQISFYQVSQFNLWWPQMSFWPLPKTTKNKEYKTLQTYSLSWASSCSTSSFLLSTRITISSRSNCSLCLSCSVFCQSRIRTQKSNYETVEYG